jgi:hypothetical protein
LSLIVQVIYAQTLKDEPPITALKKRLDKEEKTEEKKKYN